MDGKDRQFSKMGFLPLNILRMSNRNGKKDNRAIPVSPAAYLTLKRERGKKIDIIIYLELSCFFLGVAFEFIIQPRFNAN